MYRRDFGILFLSVFAIFWALQHEGTYEYRKAFYFDVEEDPYQLAYDDVIPPPVVADLNGDGSKEIIMVTHNYRLEVISPSLAARAGDGFAKATHIGGADLASSRVRLPVGRRPVSLAVGYLDPPNKSFAQAPRKMVIVVVTSGWHTMCFDHNLNLMWETSIHEKFPRHASIREVAILITHHKVKERDRGMVVIGGSVSLGDLEADADDSVTGDDEFYQELATEEEELGHAQSGRQGIQHDLDAEDAAAHMKGEVGEAVAMMSDELKHGVDLSRHFQWHAFEGGHGAERWHNAGADFTRDLDQLKQVMVPQHDYRLDAASLEGRRYGETSCRDYRESILHALPHSWTERQDTRLELAHFAKHRDSHSDAKRKLGAGQSAASKANAATGLKHHHGINERSTVASALGTVASKATASGKGPPALDHDPHHPQPHHHHPPNALVAHLQEGLDVVNLFNGRPICKLYLQKEGLHADLNGDGVFDHVVAVGSRFEQHLGAHAHQHMEHCHGYVHSGLPATLPLFNGTICKNALGLDSLSWRSHSANRMQVEMAPPVMLPVPTAAGHYRAVRGQHGLAVFLNSRGELTAFDFHGSKRWQLQTSAAWLNQFGEHRAQRVAPTLLALALHSHAIPTAVLVAGTHTAALYNLNGQVLDSLDLPEAPTHPLIPTDFNGDGLTDLILVTRKHVYGFQLVRRLGAGLPYAAMLGCLMIAMLVVYITQQGPSVGHNRRYRSTDRVD